MRVVTATITGKGQVTIPVDVRRHLGIQEGDRIEFFVREDGCVQVRRAKYPTVTSLRGAAASLKEPKTWEEIENSAREERVEAILRDK